MLLIWLLIPAASAMMDCMTACDQCQTGSDPIARLNSCSLCKECVLTVKRRMMELHLPNQQNVLVEGEVQFPSQGNMVLKGKVLSDKQKKELKDLEKKEFAQMMKDYGWQPQDFLEDNKPDNNDDECIPQKKCLEDSDEYKERPKDDDIGKLINKPTSKTECPTLPQIVCPTVPQVVCPPYCLSTTVTTTSISCPPVIPCDERDKLTGPVGSSSTMPFGRRNYFLRKLARLEAAEAEAMGCPPQPICSDNEDYEEKLIISSPKKPHTRRSTRFTSTKTPPTEKSEDTCVACVPPCSLPCPLYPALFPPIPIPYPVPQTIPPQALQVLMTLNTAMPKKKGKVADIENSANINSDDDEQEKKLPKKKAKSTKDYEYLFVGIPKDGKKLRRG